MGAVKTGLLARGEYGKWYFNAGFSKSGANYTGLFTTGILHARQSSYTRWLLVAAFITKGLYDFISPESRREYLIYL